MTKVLGVLCCVVCLVLSGCNSASGGGDNPTSSNTYTVTWKNYDGSVLETDLNVEEGTVPQYNGDIPTKEKDEQFSYSFSGWTPTIKVVSSDITYVAQYSSSVNKYTVTWKNWDGSILETDENVPYGTTPSYDGLTPSKPSDDQGKYYDFVGWSPTLELVKGNATYTATFEEKIHLYTVLWKNWDGSILETDENVPYGTTPSYDGEIDSIIDNQGYAYKFDKWSPQIVPVTEDATYKAQYKYAAILSFIELADSTIEMAVGETYDLALAEATDVEYLSLLKFEVEDPNVLTVSDEGQIYGVSEGTTKVTLKVKSNDSYCDSCEVTVTKRFLEIFNGVESVPLFIDYPFEKSIVTSSYITDGDDVNYVISNPDIIGFNEDGYLYGKEIGTSSFYAITESGIKSNEVTINVSQISYSVLSFDNNYNFYINSTYNDFIESINPETFWLHECDRYVNNPYEIPYWSGVKVEWSYKGYADLIKKSFGVTYSYSSYFDDDGYYVGMRWKANIILEFEVSSYNDQSEENYHLGYISNMFNYDRYLLDSNNNRTYENTESLRKSDEGSTKTIRISNLFTSPSEYKLTLHSIEHVK